MKKVKRVLQWAVWSGLALVLVACGNGGKGIPPEEKRVVIGTPAHIKAKRESTHRLGKPLPIGVTHQRFKDGKLLADDAPHPYTMSSGTVLVGARNNGMVQVAYHETAAGVLSGAVPSNFLISDTSIVSTAVVDPRHPNAVLLTLTGAKGNSYITGLDDRGNAVSKFMVLSAEPDKDVLVVSDPNIHPMLCSSRVELRFGTVCDYATSTNFDLGESGSAFSIDAFLKDGTPPKKYILFDAVSIEKLKALNPHASPTFGQKAIYFENIDTLVVMDESGSKVERMAVIGRNPMDPADSDPNNPSLWRNALPIHHLATQDEFNTYIDFGGTLTSSRLRDEGLVDELVHEIQPGSSIEASLVGVTFTDGTELSTSEDRIAYALASSRYSVDAYKYELRHKGQRLGAGKPECYAKPHFGVPPKFSLNSFKTEASTRFSSHFSWNAGKPNIGLGVNPLVNMGGQISLQLVLGGTVGCSIELAEFTLNEIGVPLFGTMKVVVPIEAKSEFFVDGSGAIVIVSPQFSIGSADNINQPGSVGIKYTSGEGLQPDYSMKAVTSKQHLGVAEATNFSKVSGGLQDSAGFEMGYRAGIGLGLVLRGEGGSWIFRTVIDAELADVLIGVETSYNYLIDSARKKYKKFKSESEGGVGIFANFEPTITVKNRWFSWSFNLFSLGSKTFLFAKFPFQESEEEDFEPVENVDSLKFTRCHPTAGPACSYQDQVSAAPNIVEYVNSSEKFSMDVPLTAFSPDFYRYAYLIKDKQSGDLVVKEIPMVFPDGISQGKKGYANKYGVTDVLAEAVYSSAVYSSAERYCAFSAWGDKVYTRLFRCPD